MQIPFNQFKAALRAGRNQFGLWLGLGETFSAEICAGAGFDWLLIDAEHGPNDLRSILAQLQASAPYASQAVVRPPQGDHVLIKQLLETGVQTLLIPMVESAAQARGLVEAMRYPPAGIRGVGSALARASRWGRIENYAQLANEQMCLLVQVETRAGYEQLDAILAVDGVDGVFFGSADLAASYDYLGQSTHPEIVAAIEHGLQRVRAAGLAGGVLCSDKTLNDRYMQAGARFVAVGVDALLLTAATTALCRIYKPDATAAGVPGSY
ncbi:aldolase/citrate lyase family protein [Dechloromonas denitrificans]|uniref:aldolase/citrate lyase family protein n=1 Tax=Dechloromonas denitrificans TaxID=281362 RepID=UPI001CFBC362|nr:HpcH/HpaI aldolase/citrate lyase family protein [Dechloromonas denitrificans]UCV07091.1 HpcH/HpaI aldolase/citrate lyase family protein [Dechloromonas denitrificans]